MKDDKWVLYALGLLLGGMLGILVPQVWKYLSWVAAITGAIGLAYWILKKFKNKADIW